MSSEDCDSRDGWRRCPEWAADSPEASVVLHWLHLLHRIPDCFRGGTKWRLREEGISTLVWGVVGVGRSFLDGLVDCKKWGRGGSSVISALIVKCGLWQEMCSKSWSWIGSQLCGCIWYPVLGSSSEKQAVPMFLLPMPVELGSWGISSGIASGCAGVPYSYQQHIPSVHTWTGLWPRSPLPCTERRAWKMAWSSLCLSHRSVLPVTFWFLGSVRRSGDSVWPQ